MAVVYLGRDLVLERDVAVKVMHPHLATREESRLRFSREAQAVARLRHPSILEIFDVSGDGSEVSYIVTELVQGRTLRVFGEEEGFPLPELAAMVGVVLGRALCHAHAQGVIHRDLKPENVMVREDGALKLMDFGIARMIGSEERMTLTGALMGSPHHMAPEIIEGKEAGEASDLFSLGTILYWMVTGAMPFDGNNPTHTLRKILESDYADPRLLQPGCPESLAEVIGTCLRREPEARYASAEALVGALCSVLGEVGIDRHEEELAAYFLAPRAREPKLGARIRAALLARSEEAIAAGRQARALSFLDRLLCLDPDDPQALELLRGIRRRGRKRAWGMGAVGAVLGVGLVALVATQLPSSPPLVEAPPPAQAPPVTSEEDPGPAAEGGAQESPSQREEVPPSPPPRPDPRETPPAEPAPRHGAEAAPGEATPKDTGAPGQLREVHLRWVPQGAVLYLDGKRVDTLAPSWRGTLPVGSHRLALLHSACCHPFEESLEVETGDEPIRRSIALQPKESGWFEVACDDPAAEVWLEGSFRGTVAEVRRRGGVAVAFSKEDMGRERYVKTVQFDVLPPQGAGWPPLRGEVVVRAGQRTQSPPLSCKEQAG